jgi:hypothetical protein
MPTKYALIKTVSTPKDALNAPIEYIYKTYDTFAHAQQARQTAFLEYYRFRCEALNQTIYYADTFFHIATINHLKYLEKHYFIDFEGLLATTDLKDFKYKTVVGWFSVELMDDLLNDEEPLPIQEPWQTRRHVWRAYTKALINYNLKERSFAQNNSVSFVLRSQLYPSSLQYSAKYKPFEMSLDEQYAYAATHFNIDFKKIWATKYVKNFKYKKYLDDFFRRLFGLMVFQSDEAMLDLVYNPFEIIELTEKTVFYKIYTNPTFSDYHNPNTGVGFQRPWDGLYNNKPRYFLQSEQAIHAIGQLLWHDLTQLNQNSPYQLKGSLAELSETPVLLNAYIQENQLFKYDYEFHYLKIQPMELPKETIETLMFGLVQLLRSSKMPYYWETVPLAFMNEMIDKPATTDTFKTNRFSSNI